MTGARSTGRHPFRWALLALVVTTTGLVGCGDDDDGDGETDAQAIGPGAEEPPAVVELAEQPQDEEPDWIDDVPEVEEPGRATPRELRLAATDTGAPSPVGPAEDGEPPELGRRTAYDGSYEGTMQIEMAYFDRCHTADGSLGYIGSQVYQMPVEVIVNPPAAYNGVQEPNPFNLIVSSQVGVEGSLGVVSGSVLSDVYTGGGAVFTFWNIAQSGDQFSGSLVNRYGGTNYNQIETTELLGECQPQFGTWAATEQIVEGAQLTGSFNSSGIHVEVTGQIPSGERSFRAVVDASRS